MAATTYTINNVLKALLRGEVFAQPNVVYVSLHTAAPGLDGENEVLTTAWPSYQRRDSADGDALVNAWGEPDASGISYNLKQLIWPIFDSETALTITHFALWDAATGGNCLNSAALDLPRELAESQVFVADTGKLGVQLE